MKHLLFIVIFCTSLLTAQISELTGKIIDAEGEPIYLANVAIEKTSIGTTTNREGEFVLKAEFDEGDNLIVSFIGFKSVRKPVSKLSFESRNTFILKAVMVLDTTISAYADLISGEFQYQ